MTDHDPPTQPLPPESPPPERPRLTRSHEDRILLGVCGGIARHLGVDALLVRAIFVVLSLLGGGGVFVYLVLALLVASDERTDGAGSESTFGVVSLLVLLGMAAFVFGIGGDGLWFFAPGVGFVALLSVAGVLALRAMRGDGAGAGVGGAVVMLVVVWLAGMLGIVAAAGVAFGGGTPVAIAVVALGTALVVGGVLGGARWLVLPALAVALPATMVAATDLDLRGGVGNREIRPATQAAVQPSYRIGLGRVQLDLRDVELSGVTDVRLSAGMGQLHVLVPRDACVSTAAETVAGDVDLFGRSTNGVEVTARDEREPVPGRPVLRIDAAVTVGQITVSQDRVEHRFGPGDRELQRQEACAG